MGSAPVGLYLFMNYGQETSMGQFDGECIIGRPRTLLFNLVARS